MIVWYDYGARFYDPTLGRWHILDAMYVRHYDYSPYAYVLNYPMLLIDPNGLTDYKYDKNSGEVTQVGEANDDPDRIVRTKQFGKNKGEVKKYKHGKKEGQNKAVAGLDNIEKGILSDGMNFKTDDNIIQVWGEGQPTLKGVQDFLVGFSDYTYTEMSGAYLQADGESKPNAVYIDESQGNDEYTAYTSIKLNYLGNAYHINIDGSPKLNTHFHTHITTFNLKDKYPSQADKDYKKSNSNYYRKFIILSDLPEGQDYKY